MRVLVCGGREYADFERLRQVLDFYTITTLIEGCATGADSLAEQYAAIDPSIELLHFPADWERYGRAAGPKRNLQMLVEGQPDLVVAFPGGRGTANMVKQAARAHVPVQEVE